MTTQCTSVPLCADTYAESSNAFGATIGNTVSKIRNWWSARKQRRMDQKAFRQILSLSDAAIRDIGVTRSDVIWANSLPLGTNASAELKKAAHRNREFR